MDRNLNSSACVGTSTPYASNRIAAYPLCLVLPSMLLRDHSSMRVLRRLCHLRKDCVCWVYKGRSSRREHAASHACHCSMEPTLCVNSALTSADSACACHRGGRGEEEEEQQQQQEEEEEEKGL